MARALPNDPIYPPLLRGAVIRGMKLGRGSGEWGREEIDNLPIGPGGAAEVDDETTSLLLLGDKPQGLSHPGRGRGEDLAFIRAPQWGRFGVD